MAEQWSSGEDEDAKAMTVMTLVPAIAADVMVHVSRADRVSVVRRLINVPKRRDVDVPPVLMLIAMTLMMINVTSSCYRRSSLTATAHRMLLLQLA